MGWMTTVKPEEKTNPVPTATSGNVKISSGSAHIQGQIGDMYGNFLLVGPLIGSSGYIVEDEVWLDIRTLIVHTTSTNSLLVDFEGKVDLNYPVSNYMGWVEAKQLIGIPIYGGTSTPSGIPITP